MVSATASKKDGIVTVSLANTSLTDSAEISLPVEALGASKVMNGEILTSANIADYNSFDNADKVKPAPFKGASVKKGNLTLTLPAASIVSLQLN